MFGFIKVINNVKLLNQYYEYHDERIRELTKDLLSSQGEIEKLKWMIENPNPYKVGQKLKDGSVITEVFLHWNCGHGYSITRSQWMYKSVKPLKK